MIFILIVLALALTAALVNSRMEDRSNSKEWEAYLANETSQTQRILSRAARPLASIPALQRQVNSTATYRHIQSKLRTGGAFGGSLEVYLSVQVLSVLVSAMIIIGMFFSGMTGFFLYVPMLMAVLLVFMPYDKMRSLAKEKSEAVTEALPDFAELLIMVLPRTSILPALSFTAERTKGPVAEEIQAMVKAISSRSLSETEAFQLAAERLGTPEARAFMTTLMNALIEGTKAMDAIKSQAESMRKVAFQQRRAVAKRLPTKITINFAIHFLPAVLITAILPMILGLGSVLS